MDAMPPGTDSVARYRAAFAQRNMVSEIEALAARALPPLTILDLDGWQLRSAGGLTRRANSVWPRSVGSRLSMDDRLRQAEAFYVQGGIDPAVQLSPSARPDGLEAALAARGYRPTPAVDVLTRRLDRLAALRAVDATADPGVELLDRESWLPLWTHAAGAHERHLAMATRMLERTVPPAVYAVAADDGQVAVARGVLDAGWLRVDLLAATPGARRRGTGTALLRALSGWALDGGGAQAHVEVSQSDDAALALTAAGGFRRAYRYRFRVLPKALASR
jgi:N-acetylglutamate synthase